MRNRQLNALADLAYFIVVGLGKLLIIVLRSLKQYASCNLLAKGKRRASFKICRNKAFLRRI